jgi:hypothetical protein
MVLWEEDSFGTVQLRDLYQGVGSTDTASSLLRNLLGHSQFACDTVGAGLRQRRGEGGGSESENRCFSVLSASVQFVVDNL